MYNESYRASPLAAQRGEGAAHILSIAHRTMFGGPTRISPATPGFLPPPAADEESATPDADAAGLNGVPQCVCSLCKETCPSSSMTSYGRSMACKPCKTTYNRNGERMKTNANLRAWFKALSCDAKAEWYAKQKADTVKWQTRRWEGTEMVCEERRFVRTDENVIFDYVPLREWIKEERKLGFTTAQAIVSFKAAWKDPKARTCLEGGIQHVAIYKGIRKQTGHGEDSQVSV